MSSRARWWSGLLGRGGERPGYHRRQLLDRRHVDRPVVEVVLESRQVAPRGIAGPSRSSCRTAGPSVGSDVLRDEARGSRSPASSKDTCRGLDRVEQAAPDVCMSHEPRPSRSPPRAGLLTDEVGPFRPRSSSSSVTRVAISTITSLVGRARSSRGPSTRARADSIGRRPTGAVYGPTPASMRTVPPGRR